MRPTLTLVKILALLLLVGCASGPSPRSPSGEVSPGTRDAELAAVGGRFGTRVVYLGDLELPLGTVERFAVGAEGVLLYLPVPDSPLVVVGTARRFVGRDGLALSAAERELATELWRVGLDDPRRRALHECGAALRQTRTGSGLIELVFAPARHPDGLPPRLFETLAAAPKDHGATLVERVLVRRERPRRGVDRARARSLESGRGAAAEEAAQAMSAIAAHPDALTRLRRDREADAILIMGPIDRWTALTASVGWLAKARGPAPSPGYDGAASGLAAWDEPTSGPRGLLLRLPLPDSSPPSPLVELAAPAVAELWKAPGPDLELREVHLERREPEPSLNLVFELAPTLSSSAAAARAQRALASLLDRHLDAAQRRTLAAEAETRRRESLAPAGRLAATLLASALDRELELVARPVKTPRPRAIELWLRSVLTLERAAWVPLELEPEPNHDEAPSPVAAHVAALLGPDHLDPPGERSVPRSTERSRRSHTLVLDTPGLSTAELALVLTSTGAVPPAAALVVALALGDGPLGALGRSASAKVSETTLGSLEVTDLSASGAAIELDASVDEVVPLLRTLLRRLRAAEKQGLEPADLEVARRRALDWTALRQAMEARSSRAGRTDLRGSPSVSAADVHALSSAQLQAAVRALTQPAGLRVVLRAGVPPDLLAELARLLPSGEIELRADPKTPSQAR